MMEYWKDIEDFEGLYQVSNLGNVMSLDRYVFAGKGANHATQHIKAHLLKQNKCGDYSLVVLCKDGKTYSKSVHRLVAQAFIPNPDNLPCVNHKDEDKHNNIVDNLEWCTYKYNNEYNGRVDKCRAKISNTLTGRRYNRVLTMEQRENIRLGAIAGWKKRKEKEV